MKAAVEVSREGSVEALRRVLSYLVRERQRLRTDDAPQVELEANRKAIVAIQMQLGRALGNRFRSRALEEEAAAASRSRGGSRS